MGKIVSAGYDPRCAISKPQHECIYVAVIMLLSGLPEQPTYSLIVETLDNHDFPELITQFSLGPTFFVTNNNRLLNGGRSAVP